MSYIITKKAMADLDALWFHIVQDKVSAADKVENDLLEAFDLIASHPYIGAERPDLLNLSVRFWIVHNYYIIYNPNVSPIQILRIINSYQDIKTHL